MKEWSYNFEPVSKGTWVKQIERELKGKSLQSLHTEWWPGAPLDPIHHADDRHALVQLPSHLFATPPAIIELVDATAQSATQLNETLLRALRYGADTIALNINHAVADQIDRWLDGIYADMINWYVTKSDPGISLRILDQRAPGKVFNRIQMHRGFEETMLPPDESIPMLWCYWVPSSGNWVGEMAKLFHRVMTDEKRYVASTGKNDFFQHCVWQAEGDADYLKSIIQMRTLHIVWQNFTALKDASIETRKYLECHVIPKEGEAADNYLVRASTAAMAGCLAGVSGLCIHPKPGAPAYYERINHNIHHLLHMESGLPKQTDPLAGAYAIDHYTALWAAAIWDQLNTE
jgi:hypothetical protein